MTLIGMPQIRERRTPTRTGRTYHLRTFGCQMNVHDSEGIAGLLEADGMVPATDADTADLVVFNTCCIRENADDKLYGSLGSLKRIKDERPELLIAVGGCLAQKDRNLVQDRAPWVDVVFGTHNLSRVVSLLDYAEEWGPITEILEESESVTVVPAKREVDHSAWVTIMIGCNNSCTFCIVPSVRGAEISRRPGDIVREVQDLAADGVVEVTLLGQNVNSYGRDLELGGHKALFADLLRRVGEVDGIERIRYTSPHPKDFKADVALAMAETEAVCEQLHMPLQSGSDRILSAMHRGYTAERFLAKLDLARQHLPGLAISTDIIVGFPGESEADFQATLDVVAVARFDSAFTFIYSPRPGTAAAEMVDQFVAPEVIQDRYQRLTELQTSIGLERNQELVGATVEVLVDGPSKTDPTKSSGRTRGNKLVHFPGEVAPGSLVNVRIDRAAPHFLIGDRL
ncbi:MAG: tRNA (N6-isopentenyl adenosine(37)-C2)-methylthiotransferase MiaB [Acidimicrobiia bacterium]|nr:tRNA (N6-isopentenyl adenosine(37)-C2)-methylthiotransferase MiaB [Acidimicrobiia bacterium]